MKKKYHHLSLMGICSISLLATVGSLYIGYRGDPLTNRHTGIRFNRLNGIPICDMCRYMRIFQYPLVAISGIALLTKDTKSTKYIRPLALGGLITSIYKWGMEGGRIAESAICTSGISCSTSTSLGGIVSLPLLGVICFTCILFLCFFPYIYKHAR